jgi:hypothetical protein
MQQTLKDRLKDDLKIAIKTNNGIKKNLLKVVLSEVALEEGRGKADFYLNDEGITAILKKIKKNQEIIKEECEMCKREIPENVCKEIEILDTYLPQQMSEDQMKMLISDIIEELGASSMKDMGKVMAKFNSEFSGKADNKIVSQIVKNKLNG